MKKIENKPEEFYDTYAEFREYVVPEIRKKHLRQFRQNFWKNCEFFKGMSVLEVGCGTGLFLKYLETEGITDIFGIDKDPHIIQILPDELLNKVEVVDVDEYLDGLSADKAFDRILLIDVLEHFNPNQAAMLLSKLRNRLKKSGGIVVKVPNNGSPWGAGYQHGDLTHKSAFNSFSLRQLGIKVGLNCQVFPHRTGNPRKQILENIFHSAIELFLTERPEFWSANIIGYFGRKKE